MSIHVNILKNILQFSKLAQAYKINNSNYNNNIYEHIRMVSFTQYKVINKKNIYIY